MVSLFILFMFLDVMYTRKMYMAVAHKKTLFARIVNVVKQVRNERRKDSEKEVNCE